MGQPVLIALAVLTGAMIPFQLAFNGQMGVALKSPLAASFLVFAVGLVSMAIVLLATRTPFPGPSAAAVIPLTAWVGGLIATLYILAVVFLVPKLGIGTVAVLVIAGQLLTALALDHLGAFGMAQSPITLPRLLGAGLVVAGAALVRFF